jgi:hypothetical protein
MQPAAPGPAMGIIAQRGEAHGALFRAGMDGVIRPTAVARIMGPGLPMELATTGTWTGDGAPRAALIEAV